MLICNLTHISQAQTLCLSLSACVCVCVCVKEKTLTAQPMPTNTHKNSCNYTLHTHRHTHTNPHPNTHTHKKNTSHKHRTVLTAQIHKGGSFLLRHHECTASWVIRIHLAVLPTLWEVCAEVVAWGATLSPYRLTGH